MAGKLLNLLGLLVHNVGSMADMMVNNLLVADIDQRDEEHNRSTNQAHSPEWHNLDQIVGEECSNTSLHIISICQVWPRVDIAYSSGRKHVLSENDSLSLNDKEVDELMNVSNHSIKSLSRIV